MVLEDSQNIIQISSKYKHRIWCKSNHNLFVLNPALILRLGDFQTADFDAIIILGLWAQWLYIAVRKNGWLSIS